MTNTSNGIHGERSIKAFCSSGSALINLMILIREDGGGESQVDAFSCHLASKKYKVVRSDESSKLWLSHGLGRWRPKASVAHCVH